MNRRIGLITINVRDLKALSEFYKNIFLFNVLEEKKNEITFGLNSVPLIRLVEENNIKEPKAGDSGLYHFAVVFEKREELAFHLANIFEKFPVCYTGSADHLVSEAFYFTDLEGNGIELYFDKPSSDWKWIDGKVQMATLYIDEMEYVETNIKREFKKGNVHMGHIHLKVGDIKQAKEFYVDKLGFEITAQLPSALFVSKDKYHHHIGLNTWESLGSGTRGQTYGLNEFELIGIKYLEKEIIDSWGNKIVFKS